ncbi:MAG: glucans biosynthesis glucosyltransferase MdoH [Stagnimonas sp.]|nr:glucans biosynthesis glucosyltransferase MdoH [Stagnimonas sp.]
MRPTARDYLDQLPLLSPAHKALAERLDAAPGAGLAELERGLVEQTGAATPLDARLRLALGDSQLIGHDGRGSTRLITTPPLARASMSPLPWSPNPLQRLVGAVRTGLLGRRGLRTPESPEPPARADPRATAWRIAGRNRRFVLAVLTVAQALAATHYMQAILPYKGTLAIEHWLVGAILALYLILFMWVGLGFWTALMGFLVLLRGGDKYAIGGRAAADQAINPEHRCAILVPICNEDVARVFAGVRATVESVDRTDAAKSFDFFILSDTGDPDIRVAELEAWRDLCQAVGGYGRVFYRRRTHRIKRKSGNVADWCRRWGSRYATMVVLDADSVMSGACLKRLVQLMEAKPGAGIIQTAPRAAGRETLYSRIQQFATRVYGPLFTAGLHYWQLGESHYWGHNAIIRVAPFMKHCALGRLPGRGALSGEILSHDFVEAALMRRAGWSVWIAYDLPGSYEEMPPNLLDELKRDRRWCQGNLQNFRLFFTRGLHPAHRAVFMTGVMAYLSAPLWFLFLALSTVLLYINATAEPVYFSEPNQLFPTWPEWHPEWAMRLFGITAGLLFLPKLLAALLLILKPSQRRWFGGGLALSASLLLEMLFSALLAPVRMLFHTRFVVSALLGIAIQWKSPPRADSQTPWREALLRHGTGTALGGAWLFGVYKLNPDFITWLIPVAGALLISVPISVFSSRVSWGRLARRARLFLIPEEAAPPRELRRLRVLLSASEDYSGAFRRAIRSPLTNALVTALAPTRLSRSRVAREPVQAAALDRLDSLDIYARNRLLSDREALAEMHRRSWQA